MNTGIICPSCGQACEEVEEEVMEWGCQFCSHIFVRWLAVEFFERTTDEGKHPLGQCMYHIRIQPLDKVLPSLQGDMHFTGYTSHHEMTLQREAVRILACERAYELYERWMWR